MNHDLLKESLFDYYDDRLKADLRAEFDAHVQACSECRHELDTWKGTSRRFLHPLRIQTSNSAMENVMRQIRSLNLQQGRQLWAHFARWALPALALSFAGFALTIAYTVRPDDASSDLLMSENRTESSHEWFSDPPTADQLLMSVVRP